MTADPSPRAEPAPDALARLPDTPPGLYRHYKGGEYEVVGVARHSETLEPLVVYQPLHNASGLWVRPHAMFFGSVEDEGVRVARFARIDAGAIDRTDGTDDTDRMPTADRIGSPPGTGA